MCASDGSALVAVPGATTCPKVGLTLVVPPYVVCARPRMFAIVNGTEPARVYVVDGFCASQSVTGAPSRYANRASFSRFDRTTAVWLVPTDREPRVYRHATVGAFVPTTASFGLVS
jgi:hypothetical protein